MFQWCMFGGYEGRWGPEAKIYFTMFGGCELRWPTIAKQMVDIRHSDKFGGSSPTHVFVTMFAGTEVTTPTLAQEYLDLRSALHSGQLTLDDWDRATIQIAGLRRSGSFTLFGSFDGDSLPNEDDELEDLALNRHLGYLSNEVSELLMRAVGQRGPSRAAAVRQAVAVALAEAT